MSETSFRITLTCDAEPNTGLGGQVVDSLVPRDAHGRPYLPESHIKGLMRAALREIAVERTEWQPFFDDGEWPYPILEKVFGQADEKDRSYVAKIRVDRATAPEIDDSSDETESTHFISRTKLEHGLAKDNTLRTTEAISAGTEFIGLVHSDVSPDSVEGIAWRLSLLTVCAVGGSRSRNGQCVVELLDKKGHPVPADVGQMLLDLDEAIREGRFDLGLKGSLDAGQGAEDRSWHTSSNADASTQFIELIFAAETPVCFPERPSMANVITSGFCVPASAVQGTLLHYINRYDVSLSSLLFDAPEFRCWPLIPCSDKDASQLEFDRDLFYELPTAIRVSLSHRAAKYSLREEDVGEGDFFEPAFEHGDDRYAIPLRDGVPLKTSDGVIVVSPTDGRQLWRSSWMPRNLTAHGVVDGELNPETNNRRNLFSVEAMMPMTWRGMFSVPGRIAERLVACINESAEIRMGQGRSVRGRGRLVARQATDVKEVFPQSGEEVDRTALVLQTPVEIPRQMYRKMADRELSADDVLRKLAKEWLEHHRLPGLAEEPAVWTSAGLRFGWNRHSQSSAFQSATPVLLPGSIFSLAKQCSAETLAGAIGKGFFAQPDQPDKSKQRGYGCLAVHPGKAMSFFQPSGRPRRRSSGQLAQAMEIVYQMRREAYLPTPSQIRAVEQRLTISSDKEICKKSVQSAIGHLQLQCNRTPDVFHVWEPIVDQLETLLMDFDTQYSKPALGALADISQTRRNERKLQGGHK